MTSTIPLLIDTDPGVDDALALLMAFNDARHSLVGLTVTAGNVGLQYTVANTLKLCEIARVQAPVFAGCDSPLLHPARDAAYVHGRDGFGDTGYEPTDRRVEDEHAALAIIRLSHEHAGRLLLVALGPLTNIALALKLDPTLPQRIARFVVMGGAVSAHGNITAAAEFNIAFDPEAAHIVFAAFPKIELVDWEAVLAHGLLHERVDAWLRADSPRARFYDSISRQTRAWSAERRGEKWHSADALAMAHALVPAGTLKVVERPLAVELDGRHTRGATVVDWQRQHGGADNVAIVMRYEQRRFEQLIEAALAVV
ncbi:MAG: Inosine-uridine preferring nucleoside hydrolase [uncultured Lysobacter sp.]|uniref:Inosine-uridine preferring nucleoside hydrolase n=1 Tax=uncultured Lysobacter sp. TaxID=271060 RepID=A0A6J4L5Y2_9GAMM|nr:MAG: Inosine-uridine preferring nucleoside hydrolase [uncultured Lysobacter sp.]